MAVIDSLHNESTCAPTLLQSIPLSTEDILDSDKNLKTNLNNKTETKNTTQMGTGKGNNSDKTKAEPSGSYYMLDFANMPDELYTPDTPASEWIKQSKLEPNESLNKVETNIKLKNFLGTVTPCSKKIQLERIINLPVYMMMNWLPFLVPFILGYQYGVKVLLTVILVIVPAALIINHVVIFGFGSEKAQWDKYFSSELQRVSQYLFTERNSCKYVSLKIVWPDHELLKPSIMQTLTQEKPILNGNINKDDKYKENSTTTNPSSPPSPYHSDTKSSTSSTSNTQEPRPVIFAAIPHGVCPIGVTCYPIWSKMFVGKLCHWIGAPVLFHLPIVGYYIRKMGIIPAKGKNMVDCLVKQKENVGVVLDGVAGMFSEDVNVDVSDVVEDNDDENRSKNRKQTESAAQTKTKTASEIQKRTKTKSQAYVLQRKAIIAIALKAGVPIVPVYCFGHQDLWSVLQDPFGILKYLSIKLDVSICPFYGRWFLPLGPPKRIPILTALGEPIDCGVEGLGLGLGQQCEKPSKELVDKYHKLLLQGYVDVFEKYKAAYGNGYQEKELEFV